MVMIFLRDVMYGNRYNDLWLHIFLSLKNSNEKRLLVTWTRWFDDCLHGMRSRAVLINGMSM